MSADGARPKVSEALAELSVCTDKKWMRHYVERICDEALKDVLENGGTLVVSRDGNQVQLIQRRERIEP